MPDTRCPVSLSWVESAWISKTPLLPGARIESAVRLIRKILPPIPLHALSLPARHRFFPKRLEIVGGLYLVAKPNLFTKPVNERPYRPGSTPRKICYFFGIQTRCQKGRQAFLAPGQTRDLLFQVHKEIGISGFEIGKVLFPTVFNRSRLRQTRYPGTSPFHFIF